MDTISLLAGADNLRRLAVIAGLVMLFMGTYYPWQKQLELKEKKIKLEEARELNTLELSNIYEGVLKIDTIVKAHKKKHLKLTSQKDSLLKCASSDNVKEKIMLIQKELDDLTGADVRLIEDMQSRLLQIEKSKVIEGSLMKEKENLSDYIERYFYFQLVFILLGAFMFIYGLHKWNKSQKQSDELKGIELEIKRIELQKLQRQP